MKLIDVINDIDVVDEASIIFLQNIEDFNSDVLLSFPEEGDEGIKEVDGKKYSYLIEVFLAKDFAHALYSSLNYKPTSEEVAKRLYDYAINDA